MASKPNDGRSSGGVPWRILGWGTAGFLLLLPLVAMQFTTEVNWTASDFAFAAVVLGAVGGTFELAVRKSGSVAYRLGVAAALAATFLLVWINAAVGIIGSEDNPANLLFFGVIAAAIAGSIMARFRPAGMARAMTFAGAVQALIGLATVALRIGANEPPGALGVLVLIESLAFLWLVSAWFFSRAALSHTAAK